MLRPISLRPQPHRHHQAGFSSLGLASAIVLGLPIIAILILYRETAAGTLLSPTLPNVAIIFWLTYPIGAVWVLNDYLVQDEGWVGMNTLGPAAAMIGAITAAGAKRFKPLREKRLYDTSPTIDDLQSRGATTPIFVIAAISLGIALLQVVVTGGAIALNDLTQLFSGGDLTGLGREVTYKRKAVTSGLAGYLAPGYVKQFRDILLPASALLLYWHSKISTRRGSSLGAHVLLAFSLSLMIITSHRAPATIFVAAGLLVSVRIRGNSVSERIKQITAAGSLLALFAGLTSLLGRNLEATTPLQSLIGGGTSLLDRIFLAYPRENFLTRALWREQAPQDGSGWLSGLSQILPGTQTGISNLMHSMTGGSMEGNSQMNLWTEVWFNSGWIGIVVCGFMIGYWLQSAWIRQIRRPKTLTRVVFYSYWTLLAPFSMSPITFLLGGAFSLYLYEKIIEQWSQSFFPRSTTLPSRTSVNARNGPNRRALRGGSHE